MGKPPNKFGLTLALVGLMALRIAADDDTVYRFDSARDGRTVEQLDGATLTLLWDLTPGGAITSSPLLAGGRCYFGTSAGRIDCYDLSSGTQVWQFGTGRAIESSPCLASGVLYVSSDDGNLYAIRASDGTGLWQVNHSYTSISSPVVSGGMLYLSGGTKNNNQLIAYHTADGSVAWSYTFPQPSWSSPAVYNGNVYCGANDGVLYCFNAGTGAVLWSYSTGGNSAAATPSCANVLVPNGVVLYPVGGGTTNVVLVDAGTGALIRIITPLDNGTSQGWADPGNLPKSDRWIYDGSPAIDGTTGYVAQELMGASALGAPMLQFRVFAINLSNGSTLWRNRWNASSAPSVLTSSPIVSNRGNGSIFVYSGLGNRLACFVGATGALDGGTGLANLTGNAFSSPACGNGLVAIGTDAGHLYVFRTTNAPPSVPNGFDPNFSGGNDYMGGQNCHLTWNASTDDQDPAASLVYQYQAGYGNPNLDAGATVSGTTPAGQTFVDLNAVPWTTHVYYRVRCQDTMGAYSAWSPVQDFWVDQWHFGPPQVTGLAAMWGNRFVYLSWAASIDPEVVGYLILYEPTGGTWSSPSVINAGNVTNYTVNGLTNGTSYDFRVSAVDSRGKVGPFAQVTSIPGIAATVNGVPYPTIQQAVDNALPGQTVMLDVGTYNGSVALPGGVSILGQGPALSIIDGRGAQRVITISGSSSQPTTRISMLRITDGGVGIEVGGVPSDSPNVSLDHLILSRLTGAGVQGTSLATLTSDFLTVVNNGGDGFDLSLASATLYDSILYRNGGVGVRNRGASASVTVDHDCLSTNTGGRTAGGMAMTGWHQATPRFVNEATEDYRSLYDCPTIDRARPAAPFANEPQPNGGNANQGAFGNTQWATTTAGYTATDQIALGGGRGSAGWVEVKSNASGAYANLNWIQLPWAGYDTADGSSHVAIGRLDGQPELVVGTNSGGWLAVYHHVGGTTSLLRWVKVPWQAYDDAVGVTWPACADVDGDGTDELIVGLGAYPAAGGWAVVLGDLNHDFRVVTWLHLPQGAYNSASGETRVAAGDTDGDGRAEIVVATGRAPGVGGFAQVFGDARAGFAPLATLSWPDAQFVASSGELWPAAGDLMGDGTSEIVLGPGAGGGGNVYTFSDAAGGYSRDQHLIFPWPVYDAAQGEVRVACGQVDNDGPGAEILGSQGRFTPGGWSYLWSDQSAGFAGIGWIPYEWSAYNSTNGEVFPALGALR